MPPIPAPSPNRWVSIVMVVTAMTCIQWGASYSKQLFPIVGPWGAACARLVLAATILCLWWRPWRFRIESANWPSLLLYGISLAGMNLSIYSAFERIPLGIAVTLEFVGPITVAMLGIRRPLDMIWILLALGGICLFLPTDEFQQPLDPIGVGLALLAGVFWFIYIVFGQKAGARLPSGATTAIGMTLGALLTLPFGIATAGSALFDARILPIALAVAILSSVIPYTLEMAALKRLPRRTFGILMSMEPAIGVLFGAWLLDEHLAPLQWAAVGCVIFASIGSTTVETPETEVVETIPS